jgi:hypothetical protein
LLRAAIIHRTNVNTDSALIATIFLASSVPTTLSSFIQSHVENTNLVLTSPSSTSTSMVMKRGNEDGEVRPTCSVTEADRFLPLPCTLLRQQPVFFDRDGSRQDQQIQKTRLRYVSPFSSLSYAPITGGSPESSGWTGVPWMDYVEKDRRRSRWTLGSVPSWR